MDNFTIELVWTKIQIAITALGGWLGYFLGGLDGMMIALIVMMTLDYVTGVMCAMNSIWFKRRSNGAPSRGVGTAATASFHRNCSAETVAGFTARRSGIPMICIAA